MQVLTSYLPIGHERLKENEVNVSYNQFYHAVDYFLIKASRRVVLEAY